MKSHRLPNYARIALVAAAAGLMTACAPVHNHYEPAPYYSPHAEYYDYWYYPAIGCYYDPRARIYIYFEQDHWVHARALPAYVRPYIGSHVIIRSPHDRPYEEQYRHREQYAPERYRKPDPTHRGDDIWLGPPRKSIPEHGRDDRRQDNGDRNRNGKDLERTPERGSVSVPPQYRAPDQHDQRPPSKPQSRIVPVQREPSANTPPLKQQDKVHQQEIRKEESREQYRSGDDRHDNGHKNGNDAASSGKGRPDQNQAPDQHDQRPPSKPQSQVVPAPASTAPLKQQDKAHKPEIRKPDAQDQHRGNDDRTGDDQNDGAVSSQKRQSGPYQYDDGGR